MKEINFLPKWYENDRRRQISFQTQYVILGVMFVMMLLWNFVAAHSISKTTAELAQIAPRYAEAESISREFSKIESEAMKLEKTAKFAEGVDSKMDVASVLGEISFLVGKRTLLSKLEFVAEKFVDKKGNKINDSSLALIGNPVGFREVQGLPFGKVRFKVVISGIALDASDVAKLICKLEDSPYFCQVIPSFSRNRKIKTERRVIGEDYRVSEFEIICYLANYSESIVESRLK